MKHKTMVLNENNSKNLSKDSIYYHHFCKKIGYKVLVSDFQNMIIKKGIEIFAKEVAYAKKT